MVRDKDKGLNVSQRHKTGHKLSPPHFFAWACSLTYFWTLTWWKLHASGWQARPTVSDALCKRSDPARFFSLICPFRHPARYIGKRSYLISVLREMELLFDSVIGESRFWERSESRPVMTDRHFACTLCWHSWEMGMQCSKTIYYCFRETASALNGWG